MEITIIHSQNTRSHESGFLRFAFTNRNTASVVLKGLSSSPEFTKGRRYIAMPADWVKQNTTRLEQLITHDCKTIDLPVDEITDKWFILVNGRYAPHVNTKMIQQILKSSESDLIAVNIDKDLSAYCEKPRITSSGYVVGFRRWYVDSVASALKPTDWPHYLFIRTNVLPYLLSDSHLPLSFDTLLTRAHKNDIKISSLSAGGNYLDLSKPRDLLKYTNAILAKKMSTGKLSEYKVKSYGMVLAGKNDSFGENVKVVGPAVIEDSVTVPDNVTIKNSIIASDQDIEKTEVLNNTVKIDKSFMEDQITGDSKFNCTDPDLTFTEYFDQTEINSPFKKWPLFSYSRLGKRILDIAMSSIVLILLAPVFFVLAVLIKLTSPGPVFYKALRQGRHGKMIKCIKFRTMIIGADQIQEKLRDANEVDGPQFKIDHDPRVSSTGKFLRDTCLDEIPQFINVLLGQMSVVGPRPSPPNENSQCPSWRDARLSVRPGITGLWQILRTRRPKRDFQEWLYFDTEYVRNLSFKTDLWICYKTAMKLVNAFIDQF